MTKLEIEKAVINVFENGAPNSFVNGIDYHTYSLRAVPLSYPIGLTSINDTTIGRKEHPFVHVKGGYEETPGGHAAVAFPVGCRVFYFNHELCSKMRALTGRNFEHNVQINTPQHIAYDRHIVAGIQVHEQPDLIEVNGVTHVSPDYNGKSVVSASQAGHNFVGQTPIQGIFDKMCHELWRLSNSGINTCFFIALYTHKQNLGGVDNCLPSYIRANRKADQKYQSELNIYRDDISQIDPHYIHLLFRGVRPSGESTYFHVFIVQKPANLTLVQVNTPKGDRIRPVGYVNKGN